jgi:hypothetical protein
MTRDLIEENSLKAGYPSNKRQCIGERVQTSTVSGQVETDGVFKS